MQIQIGRLDRRTGQVSVLFTDGDFAHARFVNACFREDGSHDRKATAARVAEVAQGVAAKRASGAFNLPPL